MFQKGGTAVEIGMVFEFIVSVSRYILSGLAVLIIGGCVASLVTRQFGSRVGSYLIDSKNKKTIPLTHWENSIGRSPTCDVILEVATVSRFHAVISKRRTGWVIADTGSRAGVFVNNEQIEKPAALKHGDTIRLGTSVFEFCDADVDDAERERVNARRRQERARMRANARANSRGAEFLPAIIDEAGEKAYIIDCESCIIGRANSCDIKLREPSVSSRHARVTKVGNGWFIEDLGSSNGTKVNARLVANVRRRLRDGDVIYMGAMRLVFNERYKRKQ